MAKKTYNEKLMSAGDLPKIEDLSDKPASMARFNGTKLLVAAPMEYSAIMAWVPEGKVITSEQIRAYLAGKAGADATCPLTAGIFINIAAQASVERDHDKIPYWRTLKSKGELNEKYPDGIDGHRLHLEREGHEIIQKGSRYYVKDYEQKLWEIEPA